MIEQRWLGLREAARFFNTNDVPGGRELSHQAIGNWVKRG